MTHSITYMYQVLYLIVNYILLDKISFEYYRSYIHVHVHVNTVKPLYSGHPEMRTPLY